MEEGRALPQSLEAERAVLGGLMLDPERVLSIAERLTQEDFYRPAHGRLFKMMIEMAERGEPVELVAVIERLVASNLIEEVGGLSYVLSLIHISDPTRPY